MDIRISPSKLGNRYVLGRAGRDIRNVTGSIRIDGFAKNIISKYEKAEGTDFPNAELNLLKQPILPEALSDIQEIINELLIINRSRTDVENVLFRNISIENHILRCNMLFSKLESSSEYKEIRQGLENIYRIQVNHPVEEETKEGNIAEGPAEALTNERLINQIETVLRDGGITSRELMERIMSPSERVIDNESSQLLLQPEYIPMNTAPLGQWKSQEAKNFYWRVQRLEKQDRELVLKSLGNISLSTLGTILSEMDSQTWIKYSSSIAERIKVAIDEAETQDASEEILMVEPVPAVNYYSQLLEILKDEESLTPELLLEEKENLIKFLEREDVGTERIRTEVIRILDNIHRDSIFTTSSPQKIVNRAGDEDTQEAFGEDVTESKEDVAQATMDQVPADSAGENNENTLRSRAVTKVIEDVEAMTVEEFAALYDVIRENAGLMPQDIVDHLLPSLRVEGQEVTEQDIEVDRQSVINFLRKNRQEQGYYQELLLSHIVRADQRRVRNYRSASELAETTMNLSVSEWKQFTKELKQLSERSELSRRYFKAAEEASKAAQEARDEESPLAGTKTTKTMTPEMQEQVESTREKVIFITQLDKAFKDGVDIYEEGDILSENSIFSNYVYRQENQTENNEFTAILGENSHEQVVSESERATLVSELKRDVQRHVETTLEEEIRTENGVFSQYVYKKNADGDARDKTENRRVNARILVEYLTRDNLKTFTETINRIIREREEKETLAREELMLTQRVETHTTDMLEAILEERELIHPDLRVRRISSSMEPMLLELQEDGAGRAAVEQAISFIEKRRDARTAESVVREEVMGDTPVELVTTHRPETATREEIEEIKKTAAETKRQLDENKMDIQYIKGESEHTEVTDEKIVDMKALKEKLTVQENEIEKIKEIQERMIRSEKSDSYYTKKTITKVNEQLRMEKLRRGL